MQYSYSDTLGFLHPVMNVKYSSPNFLISNNPAPVPISSSRTSSVLEHTVPPVARAILFKSDFLTRLIAVMLALPRKYCARSAKNKEFITCARLVLGYNHTYTSGLKPSRFILNLGFLR